MKILAQQVGLLDCHNLFHKFRNDKMMQEEAKKIMEEWKEWEMKSQDLGLEKGDDFWREFGEMKGKAEIAEGFLKAENDLEEVLGDEDLKEMVAEMEEKKKEWEKKLGEILKPKNPDDEGNAIVEIRGAAGGEEAALFAGEILRMILKWCEKKDLKVEIFTHQESENGGTKETIFRAVGNGAFGFLKWEAGVQRVQRVPETESKGRVHTSTCTVAVFPENEKVELEIRDEDLKIDTFRSSGPGGQSVNTTDSAVRITHVPSGLVVICQDGKSQQANREKAMVVLKARLVQMEKEAKMKEEGDARSAQIGSGDRSEKVRTFNFAQDRVTDHRLGKNFSGVKRVLDGGLEGIFEGLEGM